MNTNTILRIILVVLVIIFRFIVPVLRSSGTAFTPGKYSFAGAAVCPRCQLPYSRKTMSPNLLVGKLERCPHCSKIAVVRRASSSNLETAEARLAAQGQESPEVADESRPDSLRQQIEDSRFED